MANPANQPNPKDIGRNINPVLEQASKGFESTKEHVRDASNEIQGKMGEYSDQGRQILSDVRERAGELYDISSGWVQENRLITTLSLAAVAGVVGFFLGRSRKEM